MEGRGSFTAGGERDELAAVLTGYELGEPLGRGAFATVFAARHLRLGREVAVKRLDARYVGDREARARFDTEAKLLASLDHPHVLRVYDYVEHEGVCALIMERVHGGTLAQRMELGPIDPALACALVVAALHGLEHAHEHGVLHRDVKPANLLFGGAARDVVKVGDFGIAKVVGSGGARLTATAGTLGTPAFMAPEQITRAAGPLSPATDVWGAAAVLYELLAGRAPFPGDDDFGTALLARVSEDPPDLRETSPGLPDGVAEAVMAGLARDPARRPESAGALAEQLEDAAGALGGLEATGVPIHRTSGTTRRAATLGGTSPGVPRRRRGLLALAGAAAVAAIAVGVVLATTGDDDAARAPRGAAAAALPGAPPGWPRTLAVGYDDQVSGIDGVGRALGAGGTTFSFFAGDAAKKGASWADDPASAPSRFVAGARSHGLFPYGVYYGLPALGRSGKSDSDAAGLRRTFGDERLMRAYWLNVRRLMRSFGAARAPAAISVEPNVFSYMEQQLGFQSAQPDSVSAIVGSSGVPELKGIPDDLPGIALGWQRLRNRYAPKLLLGYDINDWATNIDISRRLPPPAALDAAARDAAVFYLNVAPNVFDFAALTVGGDGEQGRNPARQAVYSTAEKGGVVEWVRQFVKTSGLPLVAEGIPTGNSVMRTVDDTPFHWRDSWVQWLIGDGRFSGMRALRDAGAIGVLFGAAAGEDETCPCDNAHDGVTNGAKRGRTATSADDDGGYLKERLRALQRAGGLGLS